MHQLLKLLIITITSTLLFTLITTEENIPTQETIEDGVENSSVQILTENSTISTLQQLPPVENKLCISADVKDCPVIEKNNSCQCALHKTIPGFYVCCNLSDFSSVASCTFPTDAKGVHIINATFNQLDISHRVFRPLRSISVTDGKVRSITGTMMIMAYIQCLNVSNNNITEISDRESAFTKLQRFQYLDLSYNNLSFIPKLNMHSNVSVDIRGNAALLCNPIINIITTIKLIEPNNTFCMNNQSYNWFNSTEPMRISDLERHAVLQKECPVNCTCSPENMIFEDNILVLFAKVDCSGLNLTELPPVLPKNTHTLNISFNNIKSLGSYFHSEPSYFKIIRLIANDNQISSIYELEGTDFLRDCQKLDMRNNVLQKIPEYILTNTLDNNPNGREFKFGGNHLECDCDSAKVFKLWLLARKRHIIDYDNILCLDGKRIIDLQERNLCQSPHDWTDYIYYVIALEVILLMSLIMKVSYDYWVFKTSGYLPWPANKMPKLPCDWLCES